MRFLNFVRRGDDMPDPLKRIADAAEGAGCEMVEAFFVFEPCAARIAKYNERYEPRQFCAGIEEL